MAKNISTITETTSTVWGCSNIEIDELVADYDWHFVSDSPPGIRIWFDELEDRDGPEWLDEIMNRLRAEEPDYVVFTTIEAG